GLAKQPSSHQRLSSFGVRFLDIGCQKLHQPVGPLGADKDPAAIFTCHFHSKILSDSVGLVLPIAQETVSPRLEQAACIIFHNSSSPDVIEFDPVKFPLKRQHAHHKLIIGNPDGQFEQEQRQSHNQGNNKKEYG